MVPENKALIFNFKKKKRKSKKIMLSWSKRIEIIVTKF